MPIVSTVDGSDNKVRDIREWLQRYAKFSHRLLKSGRAVDDQLQSPMFSSADIEMQGPTEAANGSGDNASVFERTGFVCRSVIWKEEATQAEHEASMAGGSEVIGKYTFLSDWERLWNFLAVEDSDEIAAQLPFLRAAMEFVFHRRIVQMMYILFVWNVSLFAILITNYQRHSRGLTGANFLDATFELAVYLLVHILFKGPESIRPYNVFFSPRTRKAKEGNETNSPTVPAPLDDQETAQEAVDEEFPMSSTLRRLWRRGKREMHVIFATGDQQSGGPRPNAAKARKRDKRQSLFFYRWINMALKILTRDYGLDLTKVNFNRRSYRFAVFFAVVLFPVYCTINGYIQYMTAIRIACSGHGESIEEHSCGFYTFQFIFSGFGLSFVVNQSMYGTCIILALASLAYGGEIAFRLAECWTLKYHSLRRVEVQVDEKSAALSSAVNASVSASAPSAALVQQRRRASMAQIPSEGTLVLPNDAEKMKELMSRDASEHYLFICELLRRASELWSPILTLFIFLALYVCLADIIYVVSVVGTDRTLTSTVLIVRLSIYVFIRVVVLFFYPVLSFAFANSYFIKMYDIFRVADESDYALIGGRDRWLRIFTESPAAWTFFGVSITPSRLFAVLWTSLVALGGLFLSAIISSSKV